jgi:hypothetical protein
MKPALPILNAKEFYRSYLVDHFIYHPSILWNLINKYEEVKPVILDGVYEEKDRDVLLGLRLALRAQVYHSIETLFELFFGLRELDDEHLWYRISTASHKGNYHKIEKIASGNTSFIDIETNYRTLECSYIDYVFNFHLTYHDPALQKQCLQNIRELLILCAKELVNRDEYNAFKHTWRLFPTINDIEIGNKDHSMKVFSAQHPYTYLIENDDSSTTQVTNDLESERDYRICILVHQLMSNIILTRRSIHFPNSEDRFFAMAEVDPEGVFRSERTASPIRITIKPIYRDSKLESLPGTQN